MSVLDRIRPAVEGPLSEIGLLVEDVAVTPAGRRRLVRVAVDRRVPADGDSTAPVPSLSLDEVADATRLVSEALDRADAMGEQPYVLEVTSPGVDRPLTEPRHFRRNVGRLVALTPREGEPVTGRLVRAGQEGLTVEVPATKKVAARCVDLAYADLARAVVQVEFSRGGGMAEGADGADDTARAGHGEPGHRHPAPGDEDEVG